MIDIETLIIKQLVRSAQLSCEEIGEAVGLLNQVTTHNDWGCRERIQINEYIQTNKTQIKQIQDAGHGYLNAVSEMATEFENLERDLPSMFESIESILGHILAVPTVSSTPVGKKTKDILKDISGFMNKGIMKTPRSTGYNHVLSNVDKAIHVVSYDAVELSRESDK